MKIMASGPITSWQINGGTMVKVKILIFLGSKINADVTCSHEMKRHLLLGKKAMTNLDSLLKSRGITLLTKVHIVKAMVFPVAMYGCENWITKNAECQRTDPFGVCYWKKHKLESRLPGEISITSDMQMTPPLWQKVKRN